MRLAQQLYEGVDIGDGAIGLITYMRTGLREPRGRSRDARSAKSPAASTARPEVAEEPRVYKTKSKNAQEAHEAIRPTSAAIVPADIEGKLDAGSVPALFAHLEARRRLADESRGVRHGRRRHARRAGWPAASHAARERFHAREARLHVRVPGRRGRREDGRRRSRAARDERRRQGRPRRLQGGAALHRAAAALLRSLAREGARGTRHRPSVDVRDDHLDAAGSRVRRDGQPPLHSDRHRQDRRPLPHAVLPSLRRVRLHRRARRRARCGLARRRRVDASALEVLEALRQGSARTSRRTCRASRSRWRARSAPIPCPASR